MSPNLENKRIPRVAIACAISIGMLVASVTAYSDTYNFYFSKPKKKGSAIDNAPAAENEDEADQTPPVPAAAAGTAVAPVTNPNQVSVSPNGQAPIIINNNNNIHMPNAPASSPEPEPVAPTPSQPVTNDTAATVATGVLVDPDRDKLSRWRFGVSAAYYMGGHSSTYNSSSYDYYSTYGDYTSLSPRWAGLLSLGFNFTRSFGLNMFASEVVSGSTYGTGFDSGMELELTPFHIGGGSVDIVSLGVLGGTSLTYLANTDIPVYLGARFTLNFDKQFGITAAIRTNSHLTMADAGIITHF